MSPLYKNKIKNDRCKRQRVSLRSNVTPTPSCHCMHCDCHHIVAYCRADACVSASFYECRSPCIKEERKKGNSNREKYISAFLLIVVVYVCVNVNLYIFCHHLYCALGSSLCRSRSVTQNFQLHTYLNMHVQHNVQSLLSRMSSNEFLLLQMTIQAWHMMPLFTYCILFVYLITYSLNKS